MVKKKKPRKETSSKVSTKASKLLRAKNTPKDVKSVAGSALSQDETKGQKKKRK